MSKEVYPFEKSRLEGWQRSVDAGTAGAHTTDIQEQMNVLLTDGKPLVVSQSADPRGDRKVTVDVTATILK
jgi:hypothetical protein